MTVYEIIPRACTVSRNENFSETSFPLTESSFPHIVASFPRKRESHYSRENHIPRKEIIASYTLKTTVSLAGDTAERKS